MALNPKIAAASAVLGGNALLDAVLDQCDAGLLKIYSGTQPVTVDAALGAQVLLATLTLGDPAFDPAADGEKVMNAVTGEADAAATGTAAWYSLTTTGGARIYEDSCGEAADTTSLTLDDKEIEAGGEVEVTSGVVTGAVA